MRRGTVIAARVRATATGALLSVTAAGLLVGSAPAQAQPSLRAGFLLHDIDTGLSGDDPITDFGYLPDESLLVTGKNGAVMWTPPAGAARRIATLNVTANGDIGLLGLAIAPDYATSRTIYTARTLPSTEPGSGATGLLRLSRWTVRTAADGTPTGLADERIVVQTSADSAFHSMTGVAAAEDGTVWLSIGDSADHRFVDRLALRSLDLNDPHGKLLHLNPGGTGVPSNPFYDPGAPRSTRSLVYANGLRSPFRFGLEPGTGRPVLGDVGWYTTEEINV